VFYEIMFSMHFSVFFYSSCSTWARAVNNLPIAHSPSLICDYYSDLFLLFKFREAVSDDLTMWFIKQ
jgi:hypothetical protein